LSATATGRRPTRTGARRASENTAVLDRACGEQVFWHTLDADADLAEIAVSNPTLGVSVVIVVDPRQLPWAFPWTMAGHGTYVLGIEPANCP
jgi:hypothetical protein